MGSGKNLQDPELSFFDPDTISKGSTGIDGDAQRRGLRLSLWDAIQFCSPVSRCGILPESVEEQVRSEEEKQHDRDHTVHREERCI